MATTKFSTIIGSAQVVPNISLFRSYPAVAGTDITATTTAPTFGTAISNIVSIQQVGRWAFIDWEFVTSTAGTTGSGTNYFFQLPTGMTADTTYMTLNPSGQTGDGRVGGLSAFGSAAEADYVAYMQTNKLVRFRSPGSNFGSASTANFSSNPIRIGMSLRIPIVEFATTEYLAQGAGLATSLKPGLINYYDEGTFTANFNTGMNTNTNNFTVAYTRIGRLVHLAFPDMRVTANATSTFWACATGTLPVSLRPTLIKDISVVVKNNNIVESGELIINPNGTMTFYRNAEANWTSAVTSSGPENSTATFTI